MIKKEFVKKIATSTGYAQKDISVVVDAAIETIIDAMKANDPVKLVGFGTFDVAEVAERECTNFQNPGEKIVVPAHKAPKFKASQALKDAVR